MFTVLRNVRSLRQRQGVQDKPVEWTFQQLQRLSESHKSKRFCKFGSQHEVDTVPCSAFQRSNEYVHPPLSVGTIRVAQVSCTD